jgi:hypothetical protein
MSSLGPCSVAWVCGWAPLVATRDDQDRVSSATVLDAPLDDCTVRRTVGTRTVKSGEAVRLSLKVDHGTDVTKRASENRSVATGRWQKPSKAGHCCTQLVRTRQEERLAQHRTARHPATKRTWSSEEAPGTMFVPINRLPICEGDPRTEGAV